jgi:hypothetical protein
MQRIKIFLASSNELKPERERFELEIYRKTKAWFDKGYFLHLDVWEDLSAQVSATGSQSEYNKFVKEADLFILLGYTKMGMYTQEEFEHAFGTFKATQKPFIFTYFKEADGPVEDSLVVFKNKLLDLGHFISSFTDSNDLWNQLNKELDRLESVSFTKNERTDILTGNAVKGDNNIAMNNIANSTVNINSGNTTTQNAEKIYNIDKIDTANFS